MAKTNWERAAKVVDRFRKDYSESWCDQLQREITDLLDKKDEKHGEEDHKEEKPHKGSDAFNGGAARTKKGSGGIGCLRSSPVW